MPWRMIVTSIRSESVSLALSEIFPPSAILLGLKGRTKSEVIEELVAHLVAQGVLPPRHSGKVIQAIRLREDLSSTALGNGLATPHCRTHLVERLTGVVGIAPGGIPFDALDGKQVIGVFLLLVPWAARDQHFEVLGRITAIGRDKGTRTQLFGCQTPESVYRHLLQWS